MKKMIPAVTIIPDILSEIENRYSTQSEGKRHWIKAPRFSFASIYGAIPMERLVYIQSKSEILRNLSLAWISAQLAMKQRIPVIVIANAAQSRAYIELAISSLAEISPKALSTGIFHREFWPAMTRATGDLAESSIFFLSPESPIDLGKAVRHLWKKHKSVALIASSSLIEHANLMDNLRLPNIFKSMLGKRTFSLIWIGERTTSFNAVKIPITLHISSQKVAGLLNTIFIDGLGTDTSPAGCFVGERAPSENHLQPRLFR